MLLEKLLNFFCSECCHPLLLMMIIVVPTLLT